MNAKRSLMLTVLACAACGHDSAAPVVVRVLEAPVLQVGVPAQLLLDVRTGAPTAGVEITIAGDAGLMVLDYAPKILPATNPAMGGSQIFVDMVPTSAGTRQLTTRLVLHVDGGRRTHVVTLPLAVSGPEKALPAKTTVRDGG